MKVSEYIWFLKFRNSILQRQLESYKSGNAFNKLRDDYEAIIHKKDIRIKMLEHDVAKAQNETISSRKAWSEVFDDLEREHKKELDEKDREITKLKERILDVECQRDAALDKSRDRQREIYRMGSEPEAEKGKNQKLTAQVNKDFENSSIPSSLQGPGRKKIPNSRVKTDKKRGGQPGHQGHFLKALTPTETHMLPVSKKYASDPDYYATGKIISRQKIEINLEIRVKEYKAGEFRSRITGTRVHADFPNGFKNKVNYDGSVKALAFFLSNECNVSCRKIKQLLSDLSDGRLQMSEATINGLSEEFSSKTGSEKQDVLSKIMTSPVVNTDFTNANVDGKSKHVLIIASPSKDAAMFIARDNKGHKGIKETPLENYVGTLVHDHATEFYKYGLRHQECSQHNYRYAIGSIENEPELTWNKKMHKLIRKMLHYRNSLAPDEEPDQKKAAVFEKQYDEILKLAENEYLDNPPSDYYRDGYNLYKRLVKYKNSELLFLHDKMVPPNNSLAERLARVFKRKQKQMMVFRSRDNFEYVCDCLGILYTIKFEDGNLYERVKDIFERERYRKKKKKKADVSA